MPTNPTTIEKLIELEVQARVAKTFDEEFDKRSSKLAGSFKGDIEKFRGTMIKIGTAMLALFGISAFTNLPDLFGIPKKIETAIATRIEDTVKSSDVQSKYVSKLRSMFAENLVYSIEVNNLKSDEGSEDSSDKRRRELQDDDARFLLEHLLRDDPDERMVARIVGAFRFSSDKSKDVYKEKIFGTIVQLQRGSAEERQRFGRILSNSTYGSSLIEGLKIVSSDADVDVSNRLRPLLTDPRVAHRVRIAILQQLADRKDEVALPHFIDAAAQADRLFREAGLRGLAAVAPMHSLLNKEINALRKEGPLAISVPLKARLANTLCEVPQRDDDENDSARTQKLRNITEPLREIALFFSEQTQGWSWTPYKLDWSDGNPRYVALDDKFDLESSILLLKVDIPFRPGRPPLSKIPAVLHRDCAFATSRLLEIAIATAQPEQAIKITKILAIQERRLVDNKLRAFSQSPRVLPTVTIAAPGQFKCRENIEPITVPLGAKIALSVETLDSREVLIGILNPSRPAEERKHCQIEALELVKGKVELGELARERVQAR